MIIGSIICNSQFVSHTYICCVFAFKI